MLQSLAAGVTASSQHVHNAPQQADRSTCPTCNCLVDTLRGSSLRSVMYRFVTAEARTLSPIQA